MTTKEKAAKDIQDAVGTLNQYLLAASHLGLSVEISTQDVTALADPAPCRIVCVKVYEETVYK